MCLGKVSAAVPLQKQVFEGPGQSVADSFCIARVTSFHSAGWTVYASICGLDSLCLYPPLL